jgi:hypothetical protein
MRPFCRIDELSYPELFVCHLAYARESGVVVGVLPIAGTWRRGGIYIDSAKAQTADFLEKAPPPKQWHQLVARGIVQLEKRGLARLRPGLPPGPEFIDLYQIDYRALVSEVAVLPRAS